eukprot:1455313-Rhodomonas_salina.1
MREQHGQYRALHSRPSRYYKVESQQTSALDTAIVILQQNSRQQHGRPQHQISYRSSGGRYLTVLLCHCHRLFQQDVISGCPMP